MAKFFVNDLNVRKQARELGVSVWQTPSFLFIVLGFVTILIISLVYYFSQRYNSPELVVMSESLSVAVTLAIGNIIIKNFESVAKTNKMKSEFVSIASHQLKTPLSQIKWELELLNSKHKKGLSEKQLEIMNYISRANDAMIRLSNDLLDVARIEQGRFVLDKDKINIVEIAKESIRNNEMMAKANNVEINLIAPEKITEILGDKRRLRVAIDNLISNAIRYIKSKGLVEVEIKEDPETISIYVKDNGVGIPEEQQNKIFQKFFRSSNAVKYQTEGTGLGLYITKNIVDSSGGKMWFKSIENFGSEFCIILPKDRKVAVKLPKEI
jgi:signal transduction histidine kinase